MNILQQVIDALNKAVPGQGSRTFLIGLAMIGYAGYTMYHNRKPDPASITTAATGLGLITAALHKEPPSPPPAAS